MKINSQKSGIMFLGDINISSTISDDRISNDAENAQIVKMRFCLEKAKEMSLLVVIAGSLFKKTFDVNSLSIAIDLFIDNDIVVIAGGNDFKRNGSINNTSTSSLLSRLEKIKLVYDTELITIPMDSGEENIQLFVSGKDHEIPRNLYHSQNISVRDYLVALKKNALIDEWNGASIPGCKSLFISNPDSNSFISNSNGNETSIVSIGPLYREKYSQRNIDPSAIVWTPKKGAQIIVVEHTKHVFHESKFMENNEISKDSEFTKMLLDESNRIRDMKTENNFVVNQIREISKSMAISGESRDILFDLERRTSNPLLHIDGLF